MLRIVFLVALLWFNPLVTPLWGWGSKVHRLINDQAVGLLPDSVGAYFQHHRDWIVALSTDADQRRRYDRSGAPYHYIDLEYYGEFPYADIPADRQAAVEKYGAENLEAWGSLPWHTAAIASALKDAFERGEWERAVVLAADLGHFVADGHQPLHTTVNYDGRDSGNNGIHALFETNMVDRFLDEYSWVNAWIEPIEDPATYLLGCVNEAHQELPELLRADRLARVPLSKKEKRILAEGYSAGQEAIPAQYLEQLYKDTGDMVWRQISLASVRLASLWYWAWAQAGKPVPP
ncbi:S1/P1 nuclease [Candidatus Neomarinimicrobiota bacterium]